MYELLPSSLNRCATWVTINQLKTECLGYGLKGREETLTGCFAFDFVPGLDDRVSCGLRDLLCTTNHPTRPQTKM